MPTQPPQLKELCKQLATIRGSTVVAIVLPEEPLQPQHLLQVQKLVCNKSCEQADVVLHSSGGDINTSDQIVELFRRHCHRMTTIVPIYAKSAASLFILGSDEIVMGELAELGPLDTQVPEREKGARRYASALNPFKTLEELQRFALETLDVTVKLMLVRAELSVDEAIKHGIDFAARLTAPLFAQLNTEKVGEYSRALEIGREYGDRLMRRHTKWQDKNKRDDILGRMVRGYPSHDYIIDYEELRELGFEVRLPVEAEKQTIDDIVQRVLTSTKSEIIAAESDATHGAEPGSAPQKGTCSHE